MVAAETGQEDLERERFLADLQAISLLLESQLHAARRGLLKPDFTHYMQLFHRFSQVFTDFLWCSMVFSSL